MILVINEWIFHDLLSDIGSDKFRATAEFVLKLNDSKDMVVIPNEDRWKNKADELWGAHNLLQRQAGRLFLDLFWDSIRSIRFLPENTPAASPSYYDWVPSKDVYLIEACEATKADLLVTTDQTLFDRVTERGVVACRMRDDFLSNYQPTR